MIYILIVIVVIVLMGLAIIFASNFKVNSLVKKYSKVKNSSNITGGQFTSASLNYLNYNDIDVKYTDEKNGNCYIPSMKLVVLNKDVCFKKSLAAIGISAHELGHVIQHKTNKPIWILTKLARVISKICSLIFIPLLVGCFVLFCMSSYHYLNILLQASVIALFTTVLFKLLLIPCELNASQIGLDFLKENEVLKPSELRNVKKILKAAGQTYLADFIRSFANPKSFNK